MPSLFHRIAERLVPSRASMHYFLAKTHYQWALHSANFGSIYWFKKAREGFDIHAQTLRLGRIQAHRTTEGRRQDARLASWIRHCQQLSEGLQTAEKAVKDIRRLLEERTESNAERTKAQVEEKQALLRQLHRRLRRPNLR